MPLYSYIYIVAFSPPEIFAPNLGCIYKFMNQVSQKSKALFNPSEQDKARASKSKKTIGSKTSSEGKTGRSHLFLSDEDLEKIKDRIRKKHRTDTTKLLAIYGLLLIVLIWLLMDYGILD